ncbi:hypothetical protein C8R44DRAFT_732550 [Mycena epipterygia]|nr:hypothetical protein C8R44DRAFT_732550 [Mycena epipterygia]
MGSQRTKKVVVTAWATACQLPWLLPPVPGEPWAELPPNKYQQKSLWSAGFPGEPWAELPPNKYQQKSLWSTGLPGELWAELPPNKYQQKSFWSARLLAHTIFGLPFLDICFLSQLTEGVYRHDPLDSIHPDAINRLYGVAGRWLRCSRNQTGTGIASDNELEEDEGEHELSVEEQLENQVQADLAQNICHQPMKPSILPEEYGVLEEEWEEEDYPEIETIRPGTKGKEIVMILPRADWFLRAAWWAQALDLMTRVLHELDDESESEKHAYPTSCRVWPDKSQRGKQRAVGSLIDAPEAKERMLKSSVKESGEKSENSDPWTYLSA